MRLIMNISSRICVAKGPVSISTEVFRDGGIMNSQKNIHTGQATLPFHHGAFVNKVQHC